MKNTKIIQDILQQEVTRREFLAQVMVIVIGIFGISRLVNYMFNLDNKPKTHVDHGSYGASGYSGTSLKQMNVKSLVDKAFFS